MDMVSVCMLRNFDVLILFSVLSSVRFMLIVIVGWVSGMMMC